MINLIFMCETNDRIPYVNTAIFADKNGIEFHVDRNRTTCDTEDGNMEMVWSELYIWDDGEQPIPKGFFNNKILKELEVEDDAPEGYEIDVLDWKVVGEE